MNIRFTFKLAFRIYEFTIFINLSLILIIINEINQWKKFNIN